MVRSRGLVLPLLGIISLILIAVAACDSSSGGGGTPPATQLYETTAATFCDILSTCAIEDDDIVVFALMAKADKSACRAYMTHLFASGRPQSNIEVAIAAGRVIYHGDQLNACLAAAKTQCALGLGGLSECDTVFEGTVAADDECWIEEECAGDAYCKRKDSDCPGACQPRPLRGADCDFSECSQSEGPTACNNDGTCVPRVIVEGAGEGQECGTDYDGSEVTSGRCASGLYCDYDSDTSSSTCHAYAGAGESCGDGVRCAGEFGCVPGADGDACAAVSVVSSAGASCNETDPSQPLVGCNFLARLACESNTCQALGDGSIGTACSESVDIGGVCDYGSYCDEATSTCTATKADGSTCQWGGECTSGLCTFDGDSADGTCAANVCE